MLRRDELQRSQATWRLTILTIFGVAAALRLFALTRHGLWHDEGLTLRQVNGESLGAVLGALLTSDISLQGHAGYIVVLYLWRLLAGDGDFVLRLFSALLGIGSTILLYLIAQRAFGRTHALWTAAFAAVSAYSVVHSQEARPYAFAIFISCLFLWSYMRVRTESAVDWLGLVTVGLASIMMVLASVFTFFLLYALVVSEVLWTPKRQTQARLWLSALLPSLPVGLYFATVFAESVGQLPETLNSSRPVLSHLLFVGYALSAGKTLGPPLDLLRNLGLGDLIREYGVVLGGLGVAMSFLIGRVAAVLLQPHAFAMDPARARLGRVLATACAGAAAVGMVQAAVTDFNWLPRHAFYLFPLVALLLPLALVKAAGRSASNALPRFALVGLLGLNLVSVSNHYFAPVHQRDDYRGVAAYLRTDGTRPAASVLLDGDIGLLRHYGDERTVAARHLVSSSAFVRDLKELPGIGEDVALVLNRGAVFRERFLRLHGRPLEDVLQDCCALHETTRLAMFEIYRVSLPETVAGGAP